jgi:hypothetical protein
VIDGVDRTTKDDEWLLVSAPPVRQRTTLPIVSRSRPRVVTIGSDARLVDPLDSTVEEVANGAAS